MTASPASKQMLSQTGGAFPRGPREFSEIDRARLFLRFSRVSTASSGNIVSYRQRFKEGRETFAPSRRESARTPGLVSEFPKCRRYRNMGIDEETIELPEALFRRAKSTAAQEGVTLKQLLTKALSRGLT